MVSLVGIPGGGNVFRVGLETDFLLISTPGTHFALLSAILSHAIVAKMSTLLPFSSPLTFNSFSISQGWVFLPKAFLIKENIF